MHLKPINALAQAPDRKMVTSAHAKHHSSRNALVIHALATEQFALRRALANGTVVWAAAQPSCQESATKYITLVIQNLDGCTLLQT